MDIVSQWGCIIKFLYVGRSRYTKIHLCWRCLPRNICGSRKKDQLLFCLIFLFCAGRLNDHAFGKGVMFPQLNLSVTGSACGALGMWLYALITPMFVLWFWSPLGKGWQSPLSSGSWNCVVAVAFYNRSRLERKGQIYLLRICFPSPALPFSLLPSPLAPSLFFFF